MSNTITITAATGEDMQALGERLAKLARGGDVLLLSGPLGAGKTTFAQGFGAGLGIGEPIVSPTFTIARELEGRFADGSPAHLVTSAGARTVTLVPVGAAWDSFDFTAGKR